MADNSFESLQNDLRQLKDELKKSWDLSQHATIAIKIGKIPGIIINTIATSLVTLAVVLAKLSFSTLCAIIALKPFKAFNQIARFLKDCVVEGWKLLSDWVSNAWKRVKEIAENIWEQFCEWGINILSAIRKGLSAVWSFIELIGRKLCDLGQLIVDGLQFMVRKLGDLGQLMLDGLNWIGRKLCDLGQLMLDALNWIGRKLCDLGQLIVDGLQFMVRKLGDLGQLILDGLQYLGTKLYEFGEIVCKGIKTIAIAACSIRHIVIGAAKAVFNLADGLGLAVGALIFETGADKAISGIARAVINVEKAVAAAVGAVVDGLRKCKTDFINAFRADEYKVDVNDEQEYQPNYYQNTAISAVESANYLPKSVGNAITSLYNNRKAAWSPVVEQPAVDPNFGLEGEGDLPDNRERSNSGNTYVI